MKNFPKNLVPAISLFAWCVSTPALSIDIENAEPTAQTIQTDRVIYNPDFFASYAPTTAADMVNQVPGFSMQGESRNRGFSQGQGNLLINGQRPSTKDSSPQATLNRITAASVVRIEVLKEGHPELAGQTGLIVNVITNETTKVTGSWNVEGKWVEVNTKIVPNSRISLTGKSGKLTYTGEFDLSHYNMANKGPESVYDAGMILTQLRDEAFSFDSSNYRLTLGLNYKADNGNEANLNLKGEHWLLDQIETSDRYLADANGAKGAFSNFTDFFMDELEYNYEVGGDYTMAVGPGKIKFIGLRRMEDSKFNKIFSDTAANNSQYLFNSTSNPVETESILRSVYTWVPEKGHTVEWAVEGVKNGLNEKQTFEENTGTGFVDLTVDGSSTIVSEKRAESSLLYARPLSDKLSITSNVAVEYSKISVTGQEDQARSYTRPKGFIALNYKVNDKTTLKGRVERKVGQLNFFIFASTLNVVEGTTNNGNTGIVPDQTWRLESTLEHRFGKENVFSITLNYDFIDDRVETIPFGDGTEGFGNIPKARQYGISANSTVMTDDLGIPGGRIKFFGIWGWSSMTDPVTGLSRGIDNYQCCGASFNFLQNVPGTNYGWGFQINHGSGRTSHRLAERSKSSVSAPDYYKVFANHNDVFGMKLEFDLTIPFGRTRHNVRTFYTPDRNGVFDGMEERFRKDGFTMTLKLSDTF